MFSKITKSKYVVLHEIEAYKKKPVLLEEKNEETKEKKFFNDKNKDAIENTSSNVIKVCISITFLLEDQITQSLQLNKLGILKLSDPKTEQLLGNVSSLQFKSKKDGVKNNFISYWKASFITQIEQIPEGFKKLYKISFISSSNLNRSDIEKHLITYAKFNPAQNAPEYIYLRGSLESIGGRMYKV